MDSKTLYVRKWPDGDKEIIRQEGSQKIYEAFGKGMGLTCFVNLDDDAHLQSVLSMKADPVRFPVTPEWVADVPCP